ncbi:MAG: GWxTD domain-containing protein [Ignavibacteria bacterium]|nr:GWxTD domain-containing protein [Ignavibacteria bacterium]
MKTVIFAIALFLTSNVFLFAKQVQIEFDIAMFKYDEENVKVETYYSFPDTMLNYVIEGDKYIGELYISIKIHSNIELVDEKEWIVSNFVDMPLLEHKTNLLGQKDFILPVGQYIAEILVFDLNDTTTRAKKNIDIVTKDFSNDKLLISDLQLAQHIEKEKDSENKWNPIFLKNTLFVIPNPSLEYFGTEPVFNSYLEVYNSLDNSKDGYIVAYTFFDAANNEIVSIPQRKNSVSNAQVEYFTFPIELFPTGVYYVQASVKYPPDSPKDSLTASKKFYLINPERPPELKHLFTESMTFEKSEFATMDPKTVETEFEMIRFISTSQEIELFKELSTSEAKQKFLFRYWQLRNPDTLSSINVARENFREVINFANTYFTYGKMKEGWRTERGRALIKYGMPTQRDVFYKTGEHKAYEEWFYGNVQGGVFFYFVDVSGFGNFIQVHSTAWGEVRNENWYVEYAAPDSPSRFEKEQNR